MAYWDHRLKDELDKSYDYEDPIFRKKRSLVQYIKKLGVDPIKLREVRLKGLSIDGSSAVAELEIKIEIKAPGASRPLVAETQRKDSWGKLSGVWYHVTDASPVRPGDAK